MKKIQRFSDKDTRLTPSDSGYYVLHADHERAIAQLRAELDEQKKIRLWCEESLHAFRAKLGVPSNCQALEAIDELKDAVEILAAQIRDAEVQA